MDRNKEGGCRARGRGRRGDLRFDIKPWKDP